jgi:UDP:flavonoid glycosyltransferase YjiC (YdhE family)
MICLLPNCAYLSETSRMIEIRKALIEMGENVCVASHGGPHEKILEDEGVAYRLLNPVTNAARCRKFLHDMATIRPGVRLYSDEELRRMVAEETAFFREQRVKAVVTGFALTAFLSARAAGVPLVGTYAGSFVPPLVERNLMPPPSRPMPLLFRLLPERLSMRLNMWLTQRVSIFSREFDRIAKEMNIEGLPSFLSLFAPDLTLVTEAPEVLGISPKDLENWVPKRPKSYRKNPKLQYAGPMFAKLSRPIPLRVQAFMDERESGQPLIYVAITSTEPKVVRDVLRTLRPINARILVAASVHDLFDMEEDNVLVQDFLPSHLVMPQVDLAITAGGQGSVQSAMACGVPLVGIPLQPEQDLNVSLIERRGAGRLVPLHLAGTKRMTDAVLEVLSSPQMKTNAEKIQQIYASMDGPKTAARAIVALMEKTNSEPVAEIFS